MSSIIKLLRKIGGPKATPLKGTAGELAIWKAGAKTTDATSLYAHDGTQWIEVIDTRGQVVAPKLTTIATTAPGTPQPGDMWLNTATNLLSIWDGATWCTTDTHQAATSVIAPVNPTTGSMWLDPGKKDLMVWDGSQWANVAFKNVQNTFIKPQIIEVTDASAALHVKQLGTGAAFIVDDEASPDTSPFVVEANGFVGINRRNPAHNLDVFGTGRITLSDVTYNNIFQLVNDNSGAGSAALAFNVTSHAAGDVSVPKASIGLKRQAAQGVGPMLFCVRGIGDAGAVTDADEKMNIQPNGFVGMGVSSPGAPLHVNSAGNDECLRVQGSGSPFVSLYHGTTRQGYLQASPTSVLLRSEQALDFAAGGAQAIRVDTLQNVCVGLVNNVVGGAGHRVAVKYPGGGIRFGLGFLPDADNTTAMSFANASNSTVGSVYVTATATAYNTSSDYRLKEDIRPVADPVARLKTLKPVNFAWKSNGTRVDGFIAHEVQAVIPEAVTGEKDAVNDEGNPVMQGIDQSKLVPLLTAALQDALKRIEALEAKLATTP